MIVLNALKATFVTVSPSWITSHGRDPHELVALRSLSIKPLTKNATKDSAISWMPPTS